MWVSLQRGIPMDGWLLQAPAEAGKVLPCDPVPEVALTLSLPPRWPSDHTGLSVPEGQGGFLFEKRSRGP